MRITILGSGTNVHPARAAAGYLVRTDQTILLDFGPRTLANLKQGIRELPHVLVFDNDDLSHPFRLVAVFQNGHPVLQSKPVPEWLGKISSG